MLCIVKCCLIQDSSSGSEESESSEEDGEEECQVIRQDSITFDQSLPVSHSVSKKKESYCNQATGGSLSF